MIMGERGKIDIINGATFTFGHLFQFMNNCFNGLDTICFKKIVIFLVSLFFAVVCYVLESHY